MPRNKTDEPFWYNGFPSPNGTVVPDDVFDVLAPLLSEAELRVLLYIIRRTFGFKKDADSISLSQMVDGVTTRDGRVLDRGTGMSRRGVMKGCRGLEEKGIIRVDKRLSEQGDNEINVYYLRFSGDESRAGAKESGVGNNVPYGREQRSPRVGNNVPPQQTVKQQTERSLSNIRMDLHKDDETSPKGERVGRSEITRMEPTRAGAIVKNLPLGETIVDWQRRREAGNVELGNGEGKEAKRADLPRPPSHPSAPNRGRSRRVVQEDEAYQIIQAYIADFGREFSDRAPLKTSTMRAYNLYRRSGLDQGAFIEQLYAARAIVKERSASIRSQGDRDAFGIPTKHRFAYWFAIVEDLLGLREGERSSLKTGAANPAVTPKTKQTRSLDD